MNREELKDLIFQQLTRRCLSQSVESKFCDVVAGKGLFSRFTVAAGEIVFEEYPVGGTAVPYFDTRDTCCSNCVRPLGDRGLKVNCVSGCEDLFCCRSCFDWAQELYHSVLCTAVNKHYKKYVEIASSSENEYYIIAARLLKMLPSAPWLHHFECPEWTRLDHLSPVEDLEEENIMMAKLLSRTLGDDIPAQTLSRTIGMLRVNVLSLRHGDLNLGFALYSTQSLMNHSKEPNCRCVTISSDENPHNPCLCTIEAITDIKAGDELKISYIDGMSENDRERVLRYQYNIVE